MLITCTSCGAKIRGPDSAAGKRVKCPKCAVIFQVPKLEASASPRPPAEETPAPPALEDSENPDEPLVELDEADNETQVTERPSSAGKKPALQAKKSSRHDRDDDEDEDEERDHDEEDRKSRSRKGRDDDDDDDDDR